MPAARPRRRSRRTGIISAMPMADVDLARQPRGDRAGLFFMSRKPGADPARRAAASRPKPHRAAPESAARACVPTLPIAAVSPGPMPMPWKATVADSRTGHHGLVVAAVAGAADGDHGIGGRIAQRCIEIRTAERIRDGNAACGIDRRNQQQQADAMMLSLARPALVIADARRADRGGLHAGCGEHGRVARTQTLARLSHELDPAVDVARRRQHAVAGRDRRDDLGLLAAQHDGVNECDRVGTGRQWLADFDPRGAAESKAGEYGPASSVSSDAMAQPSRNAMARAGKRGFHDHILRQNAADACRQDHWRAARSPPHGHRYAPHIGERRQPRDALGHIASPRSWLRFWRTHNTRSSKTWLERDTDLTLTDHSRGPME